MKLGILGFEFLQHLFENKVPCPRVLFGVLLVFPHYGIVEHRFELDVSCFEGFDIFHVPLQLVWKTDWAGGVKSVDFSFVLLNLGDELKVRSLPVPTRLVATRATGSLAW